MAVLYVNYYNNEDYALAVISSQIDLYSFVKENEGYEFVDKYRKQIMIYGITPKFQNEKDVLTLKDQRVKKLCEYVQSRGNKVMIRNIPGTPWKQYTTMEDVHRAITHNY